MNQKCPSNLCAVRTSCVRHLQHSAALLSKCTNTATATFLWQFFYGSFDMEACIFVMVDLIRQIFYGTGCPVFTRC